MIEELRKLQENSYSPYFNYPVSCIVITSDNNKFNGVNVENANGTSICAERNAIANAVANGYKKGDFKELNIMVSGDKSSTPCFACRQVIIEFFNKDAIINCYSKNGELKSYTVEELCPYPFSEEDL